MPIPWPGDTSANVGLNFHNSSFKENPRCVWWSGRWLTCYSEAQYENCWDITFCLMSRQTHSVSVFKRDWMQHTPAGRGLLGKRPTHPCWRKTRSISHSAVYITTAQMVSLSVCNRAIRQQVLARQFKSISFQINLLKNGGGDSKNVVFSRNVHENLSEKGYSVYK